MIDKIKTSAQMGAAAKTCGIVSDYYNKYDIHSLMLTINYNAELLNKLTDQVNELKEAAKTKNFEVEENTGAAVQEEKTKEGPAPDIEAGCMRWPDKETFNKNLEKAIIKKTKAELKTKIKKDIDPETKKIFVTLKEIQNICAVHRTCVNCMFYNNFCIFGEKMPEEWEI